MPEGSIDTLYDAMTAGIPLKNFIRYEPQASFSRDVVVRLAGRTAPMMPAIIANATGPHRETPHPLDEQDLCERNPHAYSLYLQSRPLAEILDAP